MFAVEQNFITEEQANAIKGVEVHEYKYRSNRLKRAPKHGYYRTEPVHYSWGQHVSEHHTEGQFPQWMEDIAKKIDQLGEQVNHAIIIKYDHGTKTHAPWHSDKCEELGRKTGCMKRGTSFFVISVGTPRTFQMGHEGNIVWEEKLPHRSLLKISAEDNVRYQHRVPQDPSWEGVRWSLIFRTIKDSREPTRREPTRRAPTRRLNENEKFAVKIYARYLKCPYNKPDGETKSYDERFDIGTRLYIENRDEFILDMLNMYEEEIWEHREMIRYKALFGILKPVDQKRILDVLEFDGQSTELQNLATYTQWFFGATGDFQRIEKEKVEKEQRKRKRRSDSSSSS